MLRFATRLTLVPVLLHQPIQLTSRRALAKCAALLVSGTLAVGLFATAASDLAAAVYTYSPANSTTDLWSAGADWSAAPVSGTATELTFVDATGSTAVASSLANTNTDDISGLFQLNILDLGGAGPASGAAIININSNSPTTGLQFISNGAAAPVVNLSAIAGTAGLTYNINAPLTLASNLTFQGAGTATFNVTGGVSGTGGITKSGTSSVTLSGTAVTYSGATIVTGGTLTFQNAIDFASSNFSGAANSFSTSAGATLNFSVDNSVSVNDGANYTFGVSGGTTVSGNGTFEKSGNGIMALDGNGGGHQVTFAMTGGTIDIEGGTLRNGGWAGGVWTNNRASMNIGTSGTFDLWDGNPVFVDALTGSGTVNKNQDSGGTEVLNIGSNNGSGTFSGIIQNTRTNGGGVGIVKMGSGTETLSGANTYIGGTTVNGGTLLLDMSTGSLNNTAL